MTRPPAGPPDPPAAVTGPAAGARDSAAGDGASGAERDVVPAPRRVRVVLAGQPRVRTEPARREIEEQTQVGDVLVSGLIRAQLGLAVRLALLVALVFGSLPLLFALVPAAARFRVLGLELPWLLLGVLAYPLLVGVALVYVRLADRNEQDFAELVDRS